MAKKTVRTKVVIKPLEKDKKNVGFSRATGMKPAKKRGTL